MSVDFAVPKNNEKEFLKIAEQLNIKTLYFVYKKLPAKLITHKTIQVKSALLYENQNKKQKNTILISNDFKKIRSIAENPVVEKVFGLEKSQKDFIHHRGSGMNHVIAKILANKDKEYLFDFSILLNSNPNNRAKIMGRMHQNLKLCKKYGVKYSIASFAKSPSQLRSSQELVAVLRILEKKN